MKSAERLGEEAAAGWVARRPSLAPVRAEIAAEFAADFREQDALLAAMAATVMGAPLRAAAPDADDRAADVVRAWNGLPEPRPDRVLSRLISHAIEAAVARATASGSSLASVPPGAVLLGGRTADERAARAVRSAFGTESGWEHVTALVAHAIREAVAADRRERDASPVTTATATATATAPKTEAFNPPRWDDPPNPPHPELTDDEDDDEPDDPTPLHVPGE
jgi:hypothetical protein